MNWGMSKDLRPLQTTAAGTFWDPKHLGFIHLG